MQKGKVTVLMAVYNAEKYLHRSLGSLLRQTFSDLQIVCVDDASTDASLAILKDYAEKDKRIEVLHLEENNGQAYARNKAIEIATGEFVTMLDADDWMSDDAIEQCLRVFEEYPKTDCVLFDVKETFPDNSSKGYDWHYSKGKYQSNADGSFVVMSGEEAFMESLNWGIHGVCMDRAILYEKYPYDASSRFYSDDNTARLHFLSSREVRCGNGKYYYYQHPSSVSHGIGIGRMDWMHAADSMRDKFEEMNMPSEVLNAWEWERWKIIIDCYWFYYVNHGQLTPDERVYCMREIRKAWQGVKVLRLKDKPIRKLGWFPFLGHWRVFQLEEFIYFSLRSLMRRH